MLSQFRFYFWFLYIYNIKEIYSTSVRVFGKNKVVVEEISHLFYKLLAILQVHQDKHVHAHAVIAHSMGWLMSPAWSGENCRDTIYENGSKVLSERGRTYLSHIDHIHQHILSTTGCCLAPVSVSSLTAPVPPTTSSPPTFSFTFGASVTFNRSPVFWSTSWHLRISLSCTGLGKKFAESFQSKNSRVILVGIFFIIV